MCLIFLDVLKMITMRVDALKKSMDRIQEKIEEPYQKIVSRNRQLVNLQVCMFIIGLVIFIFIYY